MKSWEYYDKIANKYDEMYADPYWQMHNRIAEKILFDNIHINNGKVLDIGAGTGYWTKIFLDKGYFVYALEPSQKMCNIMEKRFKNYDNIKIINGFAENLPFEDNSIDIVLSMGDVLSYSEDQEQYIKEVDRILKSSGIFAGTVDNLNKFIYDAFFSKDFDIIKVMERDRRINVGISQNMSFFSKLYTKNDLEKFLKQFFKEVDIYGIMAFPWEDNLEFSNYWANVLELELEYSKKFYDTAEHLMYMVVK
ncbi:class I SAM-dependent methyltransferase [Marinitoga litoralis]|uniref:class I SAM-dependent methyltransferase n=1 Tax=Marinitoga litoralis TaxID=570855 RepID=UPI00195F8DB8|nr:class I SAM-dependent methyltransferase [Marinitoga litoralis]MBM7559103.1 ubiquinone/menaquinone biosynthesis C-methylase UbiE [Marinitoga litoralis]